jgi:hypothetical protein
MHLLGFAALDEVRTARIYILSTSKRKKASLMKRLEKSAPVMDFEMKLMGASGKSIPVRVNYIATRKSNGTLEQIRGAVVPK